MTTAVQWVAAGPLSVGDAVIVFQILNGYSTAVTVAAADVFAKPAGLPFPEAVARLAGRHPSGKIALVVEP